MCDVVALCTTSSLLDFFSLCWLLYVYIIVDVNAGFVKMGKSVRVRTRNTSLSMLQIFEVHKAGNNRSHNKNDFNNYYFYFIFAKVLFLKGSSTVDLFWTKMMETNEYTHWAWIIAFDGSFESSLIY